MPKWRQYISRIAIRMMAFNLFLVIIPIAGILYLDIYEDHLVSAQERAMFARAETIAAALETHQWTENPERAAQLVENLSVASDLRVRVVDPEGSVIGDSGPPAQAGRTGSEAKRSFLYRVGTLLVREPLRALRPSEEIPIADDYFENVVFLEGEEISRALAGVPSRAKRLTSTSPAAVVLYAAVPVERETRVEAVVLVSQTTIGILNDLYAVRLGIFRIFLFAVVLAMILSLWIATTIVRPIRRLREEAGAILDRRGRLRGGFRGSTKDDEIGDLSRALERLTNRLDAHQEFSESFASDVSHEFKNPLASIRNATEMLSEVDDPEQRKRFLDIVEREVARMEHLLSALRDVTLIDARLAAEEREPVELVELLRRIIEGFALRERGVQFATDLPQQEVTVRASNERLVQIFENLLDNAVSFSPLGGTVEVSLERREDDVVVLIGDRGPGVPEGHHEKVFDRFFTYRPGEESRDLHTGLGLAIVRAIADGYGGSVSLHNRADGGATAEVRLPAS